MLGFPSKQYVALHIKALMLFTFYSDVTTGYVWVYVICSLLSSLPLISSFQVKREELLQYAQGAIAGLKIYADLERWSRNWIFYSWKLGLQWVYYFIFFICNSRYYVSKWLLRNISFVATCLNLDEREALLTHLPGKASYWRNLAN